MMRTKKQRLEDINILIESLDKERRDLKWWQDWRYTRRIAIGHAICELLSEKQGLNFKEKR